MAREEPRAALLMPPRCLQLLPLWACELQHSAQHGGAMFRPPRHTTWCQSCARAMMFAIVKAVCAAAVISVAGSGQLATGPGVSSARSWDSHFRRWKVVFTGINMNSPAPADQSAFIRLTPMPCTPASLLVHEHDHALRVHQNGALSAARGHWSASHGPVPETHWRHATGAILAKLDERRNSRIRIATTALADGEVSLAAVEEQSGPGDLKHGLCHVRASVNFESSGAWADAELRPGAQLTIPVGGAASTGVGAGFGASLSASTQFLWLPARYHEGFGLHA